MAMNLAMTGEKIEALYDQVAPALVHRFNERGGAQPELWWVAMDPADEKRVLAASLAADPAAVLDLFKSGQAKGMVDIMVNDLLRTATVPAEFGGGCIDAVLLVGEGWRQNAHRQPPERDEVLTVQIFTRSGREAGSMVISSAGGRRTCAFEPLVFGQAKKYKI